MDNSIPSPAPSANGICFLFERFGIDTLRCQGAQTPTLSFFGVPSQP